MFVKDVEDHDAVRLWIASGDTGAAGVDADSSHEVDGSPGTIGVDPERTSIRALFGP